MNERIKELAKQAGYTPLPGFDFANDLQEVFLKKFAELIVRECIKCGDPLIVHYINTHTESYQSQLLAAIADYSSEIRKHFGIEE